MKTLLKNQIQCLCLAAGVASLGSSACAQNTLVKPSRGGGLDTNAPMVHVDIFYDYGANEMHATLDPTAATPRLLPLPPGYAFDSRSNYFVLAGKPYNFQLAWNPGGIFTNPPGAALWIECLTASPGLECYDGPGNKMISPPRTYAPLFGTAGSSSRWKWYGAMAHNSYAVLNPTNTTMSAQYRVYFGDAVTGDSIAGYDDATVTLTWTVEPVVVVRYARGGGLDTNAPMIHVDIFYDYAANEMRAVLDTSYPTPKLLPLPAGYTFDARSNYYVFNGKAYNLQYAWNPGGVFTNPPGAGLWIECLNVSPGLECYDGPGNKTVNPPRIFAPIFGTAGSSARWQWYGSMAHNSYAALNPTNTSLSAQYRLYFGDAVTGDPVAGYDDATITLTWLVDLPVPPVFRVGAVDQTNAAPLCLLNAVECVTNNLSVVNLRYTNAGPCALHYQSSISLLAVPATVPNGGPAANHASPGSRLALQFVSLVGPPGGSLRFWEAGQSQPCLNLSAGAAGGTNCIVLSQNEGEPNSDPYGCIKGRHFAVDIPGLYCLGFRFVDHSTNGPGGTPIHASSPDYYVYLQAGLVINALARQGTTATALFGGEATRTFYLERSPVLGPTATWKSVAGPLTGASRLQMLQDAAAPAEGGYFRLRITTP